MSVPPVITIMGPVAIPIRGALPEDVVSPVLRKSIAASGSSLVEPVAELTSSTVLKPLKIIAANVVAPRKLIRADGPAAVTWINNTRTELRRSGRRQPAAG